ncbi:MAG: hypothetical protein IMZ55_07395 [Acidobacteria bacterium]|nr:hypothetical protein [Acidobacteriota bacterium]
MPDYVLGLNAKLYYGTAGAALGALAELTNVRDVSLSLEKGEADVTTRANSGWRATAGTLKSATLDFQMVHKPGDAGFEAIRTAFLANTTLEVAALTGERATSNTEGPQASWSITNFSRNEGLEEAITYDVTLKMATYTTWVDIA